MGNYFGKFPLITYNGYACRNITSRVVIDDLVLREVTGSLRPYLMGDGQRLDNLSFDYYKDSDYMWLIALANQMTDLYYDVPLSDSDLNDLITAKYGSITFAQTQSIVSWRNAWRLDESILTLANFDTLPTALKRYWNPVVNYLGDTTGYVRKQEDWQVTTNMVQNCVATSNAQFTNTEFLAVQGGGNNTLPIAQVILTDGSPNFQIQHVMTNLTAGTQLKGLQSNNTYTLQSDANTVVQAISTDEMQYWAPYFSYDMEFDNNEAKRQIWLVDASISAETEKQLQDLMGS